MTFDANLVEGFKFGVAVGFIIGAGFAVLLYWVLLKR